VLTPHPKATQFDANDFYRPKDFPATKERMAFYKATAFPLACKALDRLDIQACKNDITHIVVTTCTGFYAPGLDQDIIRHYGLNNTVERTIVGFMGCQASINAMKLSHHIVRSDPAATVLILNLELCTLHLQEADDIDQIMSFLIFADGCAASIVSAKPVGIEMLSFYSGIMPDSHEEITWHVGDTGFDMILAREVPATISANIANYLPGILNGNAKEDIAHWAVHPGGRAILDSVRTGLSLSEKSLQSSREVLRQYGNMSSATLMFVLKDIMEKDASHGVGVALAFGPGLTAESMLFRTAAV
jgi:predicted naringenin-chalcone synthase